MRILPHYSLIPSRQKALAALHAMRSRAESAMQDAQVDHGTQSRQFALASSRYEQATAMLNEQISTAYYEAIK